MNNTERFSKKFRKSNTKGTYTSSRIDEEILKKIKS